MTSELSIAHGKNTTWSLLNVLFSPVSKTTTLPSTCSNANGDYKRLIGSAIGSPLLFPPHPLPHRVSSHEKQNGGHPQHSTSLQNQGSMLSHWGSKQHSIAAPLHMNHIISSYHSLPELTKRQRKILDRRPKNHLMKTAIIAKDILVCYSDHNEEFHVVTDATNDYQLGIVILQGGP